MNTASLLKRAPILVMVVCLSYAVYNIQAIVPEPNRNGNELAKGLDALVENALHAGADEVRALTRVALRDPFRLKTKAADAPKMQEATLDEPGTDPLADVVAGLSLD